MLSEKLLELSLVGAEWVLWVLVALSLLSVWVIADRLILFLRTRDDLAELEPRLLGALAVGRLDLARQAVAVDGLVRNVLRAGVDAMSRGATSPGAVEQAMTGALARERSRYYHANQEGVDWSYDFAQSSATTGLPILPILGVKGEW